MNRNLMNILSQIVDTEIVVSKKENPHETISTIEATYDGALPPTYKEFLLEYGGSFIKEDIMYQPIEKSPITPEDGFDSINFFYGITNDSFSIEKAIQNNRDILGNVVLPIADADGGDLICLGLEEEYRDKIYYWYHEDETTGENGKEMFYLIANNFDEFIMKFTPHKRENNVNLDEVEMFLDEDLLKD